MSFRNTSSKCKLRIKVRDISREDNKHPTKVEKSYFIRIGYLINQMINTII